MTPCPSEFALERWRLGELAGDSAAATALHTQTCPLCTARLASLATPPPPFDLDAILAAAREPAPRRNPARETWWTSGRRRLGALFLPVPLLGAVAAAFLLWPRVARDVPRETILKGNTPWTLRVLVKPRGRDKVEEASSGARLASGDKLRFETQTSWPRGHVMVLNIDAAGVVAPWIPTHGTTVEVTGGRKVLLDGAIELDDRGGAERVELVACREPHSVAALVDEARKALGRARGDVRALPAYAAGCHRETFWIEKVKP